MITKAFYVETRNGQRKLINEYVSMLLERAYGYEHIIHTTTLSIVRARSEFGYL